MTYINSFVTSGPFWYRYFVIQWQSRLYKNRALNLRCFRTKNWENKPGGFMKYSNYIFREKDFIKKEDVFKIHTDQITKDTRMQS